MKPSPDEIDIIVGKNLFAIRIMRNLTQETLAKKIGVTFQQLQKYEKGINRLSASRLFKAAQALDVNIEDFFDSASSKSSENKKTDVLKMDKQTLEMIRLYNKISDSNTKKNLINMLKSMHQ